MYIFNSWGRRSHIYTYMYIYICIYLTYIYVYVYLYTYMYISNSRGRRGPIYMYISNIHICIYIFIHLYTNMCASTCRHSPMGWLRLVGCLKIQVSFAKETYKRDLYSAKRHIFLSILLIVATPYRHIPDADEAATCIHKFIGNMYVSRDTYIYLYVCVPAVTPLQPYQLLTRLPRVYIYVHIIHMYVYIIHVCVYIYICMYIQICVCVPAVTPLQPCQLRTRLTRVYMYVHIIHICVYIYIYMYIQICVRRGSPAAIPIADQAAASIHLGTYNTYICIYIYIPVHTNMCVSIYTHEYTNMCVYLPRIPRSHASCQRGCCGSQTNQRLPQKLFLVFLLLLLYLLFLLPLLLLVVVACRLVTASLKIAYEVNVYL